MSNAASPIVSSPDEAVKLLPILARSVRASHHETEARERWFQNRTSQNMAVLRDREAEARSARSAAIRALEEAEQLAASLPTKGDTVTAKHDIRIVGDLLVEKGTVGKVVSSQLSGDGPVVRVRWTYARVAVLVQLGDLEVVP